MNNNKQSSFFDGIGLGINLIIAGIFLPLLFHNKFLLIIAAILIAFGIMGLGIELEKVYPNLGYTNIFMGFGFILLGVSTPVFSVNILTKVLFLLFILIGFFALVSGTLKYFSNNTKKSKERKTSKKNRSSLSIISIFSITGFLANIVTIISYFHR